jgi:hypothetical protein
VIRRDWPSIHAYLTHVRAVVPVQNQANKPNCAYLSTRSRNTRWDAGIGGDEAARRGLEGDPSLVPAGHSLSAAPPTYLSTQRPHWAPAIVGSRVSVPDYLAGSPTCMRARKPRASSRHVNVYVDLSSDASVHSRDLIMRGQNILGLIQAIQAIGITPDLYLYLPLETRTDPNTYYVIHVDTRPLDLSTAGFAIGHPAFGRSVCYPLAVREDGFGGGPAVKYTTRDVREALSLDPHDILFERAWNQSVLRSDWTPDDLLASLDQAS